MDDSEDRRPAGYGQKFVSTRLRGKALEKAHKDYLIIRQFFATDFGAKVLQIQGVRNVAEK